MALANEKANVDAKYLTRLSKTNSASMTKSALGGSTISVTKQSNAVAVGGTITTTTVTRHTYAGPV